MKQIIIEEINLCTNCYEKKAKYLYFEYDIGFLSNFSYNIMMLCIECVKEKK